MATIFYQGLDRSAGSYEEVAKAIEDYGSVEMSKLERGLSWISLFIALAPMLGFMGTVIGMISALIKSLRRTPLTHPSLRAVLRSP